MELILKISVVKSGEIEAYEASLNAHLNSVFGQDSTVNFNQEFVCAVLIEDDSQIVATGFAYSRLMSQGSINFKAGIGVTHSFLFAYEPDVYRSSGYSELVCPIHYYDMQQKNWNEFVYRGGMVKAYNVGHALSNQVIEFNGCVY
ncbi:GNAT family N-acetyltransferase [Vibrio parahaemolyticus]|nr:GNAT family N-acetyltransferase [Vibrio parahaemolyticus]